MTPEEWRTCLDLKRMLDFLRPCFTLRKAHLLAAACDRRLARGRRGARTWSTPDEDPDAPLSSPGPMAEAWQPGALIDSYLAEVLRLTGSLPGRMWIACVLLRDLINPLQPVTFDPAWRVPSVVQLAQAIDANEDFDRLPALASALVAAGCTDATTLSHLRYPGTHIRGCWALDLVLPKN